MSVSNLRHKCTISIHAPRGGSDSFLGVLFVAGNHFNPRSPWGERPARASIDVTGSNFNPRSPWGERLRVLSPFPPKLRFQSTLPVGGATASYRPERVGRYISIHAPRGGSDYFFLTLGKFLYDFNPRSPWGERLLYMFIMGRENYFNPRSPWGERRFYVLL